MILEIKKYPDRILRKKCQNVKQLTGEIKSLISDMFETMYASGGIGLAANQVGRNFRLCVADARTSHNEERKPMVLINPFIVGKSRDKITFEEGCLSFPGITACVKRPVKIKIKALNAEFMPIEFETDGMLSRVLQHEIDHLEGKTFLDRLSPLKRLKAYLLYSKNRKHKTETVRID